MLHLWDIAASPVDYNYTNNPCKPLYQSIVTLFVIDIENDVGLAVKMFDLPFQSNCYFYTMGPKYQNVE